ncbi:MAG: hypothetical protein HW381_1199, partial [Candidatus Rokubacteria bacterium]|nr:hypothetical protein [Candidatus Rokubacteria bacterium]
RRMTRGRHFLRFVGAKAVPIAAEAEATGT